MAPLDGVFETAGADPLRIVTVGHVDHGKSTLIGRLIADLGALPEGKIEAVAEMCARRGMPFEWAFVTDALKAERDQGITIDVSHIWLSSARTGLDGRKIAGRDYVLLDAPGHREFLRNMVTGAAASDAGLIVVDARDGVQDQSKRHGFLLSLLGIRQVAVAVSKMDLVGHDQARFDVVAAEFTSYLATVGIEPRAVIPVSARDGDNLVTRSTAMGWYTGPTVIEALDGFGGLNPSADLPLRLPVQDVYKFDDRRIIAGRIEAGGLRVGDTLLFSPSNKTARIASIEAWGPQARRDHAAAGESIGITLDPQIFVERGDLASHDTAPPMLTSVIHARVFWLGAKPLAVGNRYRLKLATAEVPVEVQAIERVIDTSDLGACPIDAVPTDAVADLVLRARGLVALDAYATCPPTGRFVLLDGYEPVGGGIVDMAGYPDQRPLDSRKSTNLTAVAARTTRVMRTARNGHAGGVLWFTGLSGAGKSTLAVAVEQRLFQRGYQVYLLDGDNVRRGLNTNLGFSPDDRAENIRRVGEVAALFAEAGLLVLSAFISPYRSDRERARAASHSLIGEADERLFHEVFVKADLALCEQRDPKGLYKRARAGEIPDFTGVSAPYEAPEAADLTIDTGHLTVEEAVEQVLHYVALHFPMVGGP
ncbi:MAG TPA: adenylyl-sulfate kinase [Stellaceae bacterium]|nr:adenylyl-sulfate kinase [Stellaceae bacterium]